MKMWLWRGDLEAVSYDVVEFNDSDVEEDEVDQLLKQYTDLLKADEEEPLPLAAIQPLEALLAHYPEHNELLIRLIYLRQKQGLSTEEVLAQVCTILKKDPKHQDALKLAIELYWQKEQFAEALPLLTTLIESNPYFINQFTLYRRAEAYQALGQTALAIADLEQAVTPQAVSHTEGLYRAQNWELDPLYHKQPIPRAEKDIYGVLEDPYETYTTMPMYQACSTLLTQLKGVRATHEFLPPPSDEKEPVPNDNDFKMG